MSRTIHSQLSAIEKVQSKLDLRKELLVQKAFTDSYNPDDLIKANQIMNVNQRHDIDRKSYIVDPYEFQSFLGYKDKPFALSYQMLRRISYSVPIVRSIISTRIEQIVSFCEPQKDKYSTGFVIRKKKGHFFNDQETDKLTKEEQNKIELMTEFLLNCGINNTFDGDDFDTFIRKIVNDSLTYDQMCFEVVHDKKGRPVEFCAVDASTIRIADSADSQKYEEKVSVDNNGMHRQKVMGYYAAYCQIKDSQITADYYPWEMAFGVRNPTTNIYAGGYGIGEIEILMQTITSMIWSDEYNRRFFSHGSAPKGFFKIKPGTNISDSKLAQFKQQWQAMMAGVHNSHKTPVFEGDIDWIDLQHNNRDMEFSKWQEYLIKIASAVFRIDPAEINFPLSGGSDQKAMFEGNNEARLKHSKDKGLTPLLKFIERKINKYIIQRIDPNYVFEFTGLGVESPAEELDADIKMMSNFMTVDEVRTKRGLKPLGEERGGNLIANGVVAQQLAAKQQAAMMQQQQEQMAQQQAAGSDEDEYNQEGDEEGQEDEENPFEKALNDYVKKELQ